MSILLNTIIFIAITLFLTCCSYTEYPVEMIHVKGGSFFMGSEDVDADRDEMPVHEVQLKDFYIGKYEVTQAQWKNIMGKNPSYFRGDNLPVECVSFNDVQKFIKKLNSKTGEHYRLPTEAEWEYAAKGGYLNKNHTYSGSDKLQEIAWYVENSDSSTHVCGNKLPNELGIYDMCGNVHEWCSNQYDSLNYVYPHKILEKHTKYTKYVFRGGSWISKDRYCRIANRNHNFGNIRNFSLGFRLAKNSDK